jgi:hypothetical protein
MDLVALLTCIKREKKKTAATAATTTNINYLLFFAGKTVRRPIKTQEHKKNIQINTTTRFIFFAIFL